jgi:hypothetical protein
MWGAPILKQWRRPLAKKKEGQQKGVKAAVKYAGFHCVFAAAEAAVGVAAEAAVAVGAATVPMLLLEVVKVEG